MSQMPNELVTRAFDAFASAAAAPPLTLRGGNALDDHDEPPPFDASIDKITDAYLEKYAWGIAYLDPASWRHYLPYLIDYTIRHMERGGLVGESVLSSLRPPDRDPPRLATLNPGQEAVVTDFLDILAFDHHSAHQEFACQVLEEWWTAGALYRPRSG